MERQRYTSPESLVIEIELKGILAASGEEPRFNGFNEEEFW